MNPDAKKTYSIDDHPNDRFYVSITYDHIDGPVIYENLTKDQAYSYYRKTASFIATGNEYAPIGIEIGKHFSYAENV
jgi:hypothetical protein